uniref:Uncharacterized protein n=1 Tax=Rhizophora mucronata TaxID=61149 RepID=A0A2P2Q7S0_RHIMU
MNTISAWTELRGIEKTYTNKTHLACRETRELAITKEPTPRSI